MSVVTEEVWTQPEVFVGQEVLFYPHGHRAESPHRAVVTRVWPDFGCQLSLVSGGVGRTHTQKVRHINDPYFDTHAFSKDRDGAWCHTEFSESINSRFSELDGTLQLVKAAIDELDSNVRSLEAIVAGLQESKEAKSKK